MRQWAPVSLRADETCEVEPQPLCLPRVAAPRRAIGRYVVMKEIGRGGMGSVVRAYDPRLHREVALKTLHRSVLGTDAGNSTIREARAMAKLRHPNVVEVYDVDLELAGLVLLVMELVPGMTLEAWLQERRRRWQDIVDVFRDAARGLWAAHRAGLLHRDFKPANVLVTSGDDSPRVKVADFGLAWQLDEAHSRDELEAPGDSADRSTSERMAGTPRYMAPEQHLGAKLGPATDQYALCLALWWALCGEFPFPRGAVVAKLQGPPQWPASVAVPNRVAAAIRRGLQPDAKDRWPDLGAFLAALEPRRARHAAPLVGGAAALALVGVVWGAASADGAQLCTGAEEEMARHWGPAQQAAVEEAVPNEIWGPLRPRMDAYAKRWVKLHRAACVATNMHGQQSAEVMDLQMACLDRAKQRLAATATVLSDADGDVAQRAHRLVFDLPDLQRCEDIEALRSGQSLPSPDEVDAVRRVRATLAGVWAVRTAGRYEAAQKLEEQARAEARRIRYPPLRVELSLSTGRTLHALRQDDVAAAALASGFAEALANGRTELATKAAVDQVEVVGVGQAKVARGQAWARVARGLLEGTDAPQLEGSLVMHEAAIAIAEGDMEAAEKGYLRGLELQGQLGEGKEFRQASTRHNLASVYIAQGRHDEAWEQLQRSLAIKEAWLGTEHPLVASAHNSLGVCAMRQGHYEEARQEFELALDLWSRTLPAGHASLSMVRTNLARIFYELGRTAEAVAMGKLALRDRIAVLGPDHLELVSTHTSLGLALESDGQAEVAAEHHREAIRISELAFGPMHATTAMSHNNLGLALAAMGDHAGAIEEHRLARSLFEQTHGPDHFVFAMNGYNLGMSLQALHRNDEAEEEYRGAVAVGLGTLGPDHPRLAMIRVKLGQVLLDDGRRDEARMQLRDAWKVLEGSEAPAKHREACALALARALGHRPQSPHEALALLRTAPPAYERSGVE
jgi:tetratricopeptide (TPR) repeat protein